VKKHFDNLGLPQSANQADVKKAYRKLAMRLHPDKNPDPRAPGLFAELQESYDYLTDYLDPSRPKTLKKPSELRNEKTKEERIKDAQRRYKEQQLKEQRATDRYFNKLTNGTRWKIYRIGSIVCAVLFVVISIDLILPKYNEKDQFSGWSIKESGGLILDNVHPVYLENSGKFFIEKGLYSDVKYHSTNYVQRTRILHIPMKIIHPVEDQIKTYELDFSFSSLIPVSVLFFAMPAILWFYRKKTPNFSFMYLFSLYVIFPVTVWFLISDYRWLHLITLGFL
jgi:curved DNA-binding protein CbpA